jgi:hypothetical protein
MGNGPIRAGTPIQEINPKEHPSERKIIMSNTQETNLATAENYYRFIVQKDMAGVAKVLHPDIRLLSPLAEVSGKDAVLDAVNRFASFLKGLNVRAKLGSSDAAMLAYDADFGDPIGICRSASLLTFKDGLIAHIELFHDARPFDALTKKDKLV